MKHRISSVTPLLPGNSLPLTDTHETSEARVSWLPRHDSRILLDQDPFKTSRNAIKVKVHEIKNTSNIFINTCSIISSSVFQVSLPLSQYFFVFQHQKYLPALRDFCQNNCHISQQMACWCSLFKAIVGRRLNERCSTRCDCGCADHFRLVFHRMRPWSESFASSAYSTKPEQWN